MDKTDSKTDKYIVTGMSCAACQAHVEKAVNGVDGVTSCSVSLLTNSMSVTGTADSASVIKAVQDAGYGASLENSASKGKTNLYESMEEQLKDREKPVLIRRLVSSAVFLIVLMYFSMGVSMWGWPAPSFLEHNMIGIGIIEMMLSGIVLVINNRFFINGFKALLHKSTNMDTLVAMGSGVSYIYSFVTLLHMTFEASHEAQMALMDDLYFESAAMIVTLITIGKLLEAISKGRTTNALKGLLNLQPKTAVLFRNGQEVTVPVDEVSKGDIYVVRPGGAFPADGVIVEGECAVDESALTGESIPVDKAIGDNVSAATVNKSGFVRCRAVKVGEDTTLAQIIKMVSDASGSKAPIARIADKVSGIFVPAVLILAAIVLVIWLITGASAGYSLTRAISVLVVSCPCALGLATPVAIMVGNGVAAKNGILFKTSTALEQTGRAEIIVLDKTGTITSGIPKVTDVIPVSDENELLMLSFALENGSEHPLGRSVAEYCGEKGIALVKVENFKVHAGNGLEGTVNGSLIRGGNLSFISKSCRVEDSYVGKAKKLADQGKTPLFFEKDGKLIGIIAVADTIRESSSKAVEEFKRMGLITVMLTGDNKRTAESIGKASGVDITIADVLPDGKEKIIRKLQKCGRVIMVGDGINDTPALTSADIGIAIGAGTDIAIDAADVVLMKSDLKDAAAAIRISRRTITNIHENLFWAFIYNVALIPVAAGAYAALGITMTPMFGAAAMSLSSFTVCMNALRLNVIKPYESRSDRAKNDKRNKLESIRSEIDNDNKNIKETVKMKKTILIEGMMCGHCEATVKKALEAIDGVNSAVVSHDNGTAVVELENDVADDVLTKAVEDKDFKVTGIE